MTGTRVATERHDTALVLTLDGPDRLNAVTPTAMEALHTALGEAGRDPAIRAVILTGRGRAFCAGADLRDDLDPEATMRAANRVVETIRAVDVPVIAAVNGPAVGYGAALAAAADLAVAADDAYLLLPFTGIGLVPDGGSSVTIARAVGRALAAEMALTGRRLGAEEARAAGLFSRVVPGPDLAGVAHALADAVAERPRRAVALAKAALNAADAEGVGRALEREARDQVELIRSAEFAQRSAAFRR